MANDNRRWLYDTLKMKGVDLGTYEQFDQAMRNDPKTQKWAFGVANQHGIQLGTYEQYSAGMELRPIRQTTPAESPESGARVAENPIQQQQQPDRITSAFAAMKDPYSEQYNYHQEVAEKERQLQKEKAAKIPMSPMDAARENEIRRLSPGYSGFAMGVDENGNMIPRGPQFNMPTIGVNPNQKRIDELKSQQPSYITREVKTPQDLLVNTAEAWSSNTEMGRDFKDMLEAGTITPEEYKQAMIDANQDYINQQTRILGQKATNATIADISKTINPIIEQLQAERREAMQRAAGQGQIRGGAYGAIGAQMSANMAYDSKKDAVLSEYLQAQQYLVDAVKISQAAQKGQGFWKGLGNSLGDVDTWDMGISQLVRSANLKKIVEKYEKQPDSLTDSEKALMDAAVAYMSACAYNSDKLSRLYKAGQTTGESLPFMLQFAVMPVGAIKDKVAKGILGYGIEQFGGKALQTAGKYTFGRAAAETGTALLGNMAAAGVQTGAFGGAKIAEGTISRMTGDIKPEFDENGRIVYGGRENQQGLGKALWNAGVDMYVENLSEMILTSGDPIKAFVRGTNLFKNLSKNEAIQVLTKMSEKWGKSTMGKMAGRMQFRNYPEEVAEEYVGNLLRWGASTDVNSAAEAGLDADSQIDLWFGLAPTSIAFAGLGLGEYSVRGGIDRFQSSQAARKLRKIMLEGEERKYLENLLKSRDSDEFKFAAHDVVKSILRNDKLSAREKRAYLDNLYVTYQSQLALEAEDTKIADEVKTEVQGITNKNNGYVYPVSLAGDPNTQGHIVAGYVEVDVTDPSKPRIGNDEIVTVKLNDGRVVQLSTKELDLTGTPQMAQEVFNTRAEERINNQRLIDKSKSAFHEGEEGTIQVPNPQTGELDELPSKILSVTDEGVQVEITDFAGQSTTALIPHDEALRSLRVVKPQEVQQEQPQAQETPAEQPVVQQPKAAVEPTADNIVIFSNGTEEKQAIDNGDGTYTIMEKGENNEDIPFKQTEEWLNDRGYVRVEQEQPESQTLNQGQGQNLNQGASQTDGFGQGQNEGLTQIVPNIYTASADDYVRATVENKYKGNKAKAQANIAAQLNGAKSELQAAQREFEKFKNKGITSKMNSDQWDEQYDQYEAQIKSLTTLVSKLEAANIAAAHYKTQAELQEEAERKAREAAMREQRRQLAEAEAAGDIEARWQNTKKTVGFAATKTLPNGQKVNGHYILTEAGDVIPSHDPRKNYADSDGYLMENGQNVNDNNYKDPEVQKIAIDIAQNYGGQAVEQMPFLENKAGRVLSGNNRTISGIIAAENNTDQAYLAALAENAQQYGFTPEQLAEYQHPRLQFVVEDELPFTTGTFAMFNQQEKKTKSSVNRAIANSKMVTEAVRDKMLEIMDQYDSLDSFFGSETAAADIVQSLISEGLMTQQEVAGLTENTNTGFKFSQSGREYVTDMLLGTLFDEQTIRMLAGEKTLKQAILRALPSIVENRRLKGYELTESINAAVQILYEARRANDGKSTADAFRLYLRQVDAFNGKVTDRFDGFDIILANRMSAGVEQLRDLLNLYNNSARDEANGQMGFLEPRSSEDIKQDVYEYYTKQQPDLAAALNGAAEEGAQSQSPVSSGTADAGEVRQKGLTPGEQALEAAAEAEQLQHSVPQRPNSKQLQGMNYTVAEAEDYIGRIVRNILDENGYEDVEIVGTKVIGSRVNGDAREDSDLDAIVEFKGDAREDSLFNLLHEQPIEIDGVTVDINPITEGKSGTIEQFMRRADEYLAEKEAAKAENPQENLQDSEKSSTFAGDIEWTDDKLEYQLLSEQEKQALIAQISDGKTEAIQVNVNTFIPTMASLGASQSTLDSIAYLLNSGMTLRGCKYKGKVLINTDHVQRGVDVIRVYVHERQHLMTEQNPVLLQAIKDNAAPEELARVIREIAYTDTYDTYLTQGDGGHAVLADEFISHIMQEAYATGRAADAIAQDHGITDERILQTLNRQDNVQKHNRNLAKARRSSLVNRGDSGTSRQNERNQEPLSAGNVAQQGSGSDGNGNEGTGGGGQTSGQGLSIFPSPSITDTEIGGALVDRLEDMGLSVSTDLQANRDALKAAKADKSEAGAIHYYKTPSGQQYGFSYKGKVYLDPTKINAELPLHEYGHLWAEALRRLNPENWQHVVDTIKADKDAWEFVKSLRPELTDENEIAEEVIATFSGKKGAERLKAEYERMHGRDADYKSKWGNIFKNISKAIQDFWKAVGDFLNIRYKSAEQVYDQVLKDFVDNMNPWKRVSDFLRQRDAEYVQAAESGDIKTATNIFYEALKENIGNGITPYVSVGNYITLRRLAKGVKTRDKALIKEAAAKIAPLIPDNAVLIPAPSHDGRATDMLDLAKAVAEITGSDVADVLRSAPRESQYQAKKATGVPMASGQLGITMEGTLPEGKTPIIIDNVVDSGNTAEACVQAVGKGVVVTLADSAEQYGHAASLKSAAPVLRDKDGKVIPLSKRFDLSGSRYLGRRMYLRPDDLRLSVSGTQTIPVGKNTLVGLHNISADKLRKALKIGGLANPSAAVIDIARQNHEQYGDISLIMPSSLVDSKTGRNAGTFTGDIWSPTYPSVERIMSDKGDEAYYQAITKAFGDNEARRPILSRAKLDFDDYLDRDNVRAGLTYWYLLEKGIEPTDIYYNSGVPEEVKERFKPLAGYLSNLNKEEIDQLIAIIADEKGTTVEQMKQDAQEAVKRYRETIDNPDEKPFRKNIAQKAIDEIEYYGIPYGTLSNAFHRYNNAVQRDGTIDLDATLIAAQDMVQSQYQADFDKWLADMDKRFDIKEVIFTGYNNEGDRKYIPHTLANASKIMNAERLQNAGSNGGLGATRGQLVEKMLSLAEIRANKNRLRPGEEEDRETEEWNKFGDEWFEKILGPLSDMQKISDNPFSNTGYAEQRLQEALSKADPVAYLNKEYGYKINPKGEWAKNLKDLVQRIKSLPTKYFETKFRRPVYLNEFANAVVPNDLPTELRDGLEKAGLTLFEYDPKEEGARRAATLQATEDEGIRFSVSGGLDTDRTLTKAAREEMQQIKDAALADGTFMKAPNGKRSNLNERQWLQVRTRAFKRWFGDWQNDPENASKVLDENGEPMVVYHRTNNKFTQFDPDRAREQSGWPTADFGFYFSNVNERGHYGRKSMPVFLNIRNPREIDVDYYADFDYNYKHADPEEMRKDNDGLQINIGRLILDEKATKVFVAPNPNQIKSATDNNGDFSDENNDIRFSISNQNNDIFYSNAVRAVEGIKQEKATPEQWKAMIEKNGGLKAGEDKWLGLSDWLAQQRPTVTPQEGETRSQFVERAAAENKRFTLSKQDLLDYIREHKIQIEETNYQEGLSEHSQELLDGFKAEFDELFAEGEDATGSLYYDDYADYAWNAMIERYGDDFESAFELEKLGTGSWTIEPSVDYNDELSGAARYFLEADEDKPIEGTRLRYTTHGLENKREIALTVPTIESWNEDDEVHFGDAGGGRAIAWIRFGETHHTTENGAQIPEDVLVIDEIQSKRHQSGREQGYQKHIDRPGLHVEEYIPSSQNPNIAFARVTDENGILYGQVQRLSDGKYRPHGSNLQPIGWTDYNTEEEAFNIVKKEAETLNEGGVPAAPFEKNWHELAMKRILRFAAENGYDKVAWTTGEQQAKRYDLGKQLEAISVFYNDETGLYDVHVTDKGYDPIDDSYTLEEGLDDEGLKRTIGKDLYDRVMEQGKQEGWVGPVELTGDDLIIGVDGMRGFYDDILPRFMQKYGKKWGVQVGEVTMPDLEEGYQTMHAIDINDAMRESVLEGQPMFSISGRGVNGTMKPQEGETRSQYIARVAETVKNMTPRNTTIDDAIRFSITVNHNSPYLLKRADGAFVDPETGERLGFDLRFIGKGEGGQAHGYGSYFSARDIRQYADQPLMNGGITQYFDVDKIDAIDPHGRSAAVRAIETYRRTGIPIDQHLEYQILDYQKAADKHRAEGRDEVAEQVEVYIKEFKAALAGYTGVQRHHYDVEIPDNDGTNYIEEEQPLNKEQIERIRKANDELAQEDIFGHEYTRKYGRLYPFSDVKNFLLFAETHPEEYPFRSFYGDVESFLGAHMEPEYITKLLQRAGFVGIHYDGRRDGECYVIFNPDDAVITDHIRFSVTGGKNDKKGIANEDDQIRFSVVTSRKKIAKLEAGEKIKVYRAAQVIDGKLYPPMAAKQQGQLVKPIELGRWEQAEEHPELAKDGKFKLDKANGSSVVPAAYNPYFHTSRSPLNDQFSSAYDRPNLVTLEVEVPASELTSGYKAEGAKDAVGETSWHSGAVSGKLAKAGEPRKVILSRWDKPLRIVPDAEVAEKIAGMLAGKDIAIPYNVVTPSLRAELEKQGVTISDQPSGTVKKPKEEIRFSVNNPSTLSRSETVTKALVQQANNNYNIMQSALKKVTADLKGIRAAMRMQSDYDRKVVDALLNLYNTLLQENGVWAQYMPDTTRRIATQIVHAIGKQNITEEVNTIMDHMVHAQAKAAQRQWDKLRQTPIDKINISGVVMQGKVALEGQHALKAMNDALQANMTIEQIEEQINQLMDMEDNATDESLKTQYKGQWIGLTIAAQHLERLQHLQEERQQLDLELQSARSNKALKPAARQQLVDNIKQAMRDNYIEQAEAYTRSTQDLSEYVNTQEGRAKDFIRRQDANRDKIRSYAQRDLEGLATNPNRNRTRGNVARSIWDAFASPIRDLQSLLRLTGLHAPDGEGYLYNHFMRNWMDGADKERTGIVAASKTLDEKIAELTHGKYKTWEEAARKINDASHNMFGITMLNGVDGKDMPVTEEIPLNAGNALYIYAVNKMNDGRMKLNGMNITEEDVQALADKVREQFGQEILDVVDWVQSEFFSQLRNRYNPTHEALFGAPMDAVENYFPLRINANARQQNEDLSEPDTDAARLLAGTSTGAIKRRTRNSLPLDVRNADFFQEVIRHISQMERWNAFAQWNRDANILFSDINFRNRIKGMKGTIYGEGDKLYNYMKDAFRVAIGTYKPKTDTFSEITLNMAKGVTSAKINFRIFTALKQIASFPAFFTYMQDGVFVQSYLRNWLKPHETMKWARENLPNFEKRVSKRDMGDMRLMQRTTDWQWNKRVLEWSQKYGMAANVYFDTLTCATGARAVYDSRLAEYLKKGYPQEQAEQRARQDAEQAFNTSQQSSEGAFMSAVQMDRNLVTAALTVFRTSPIQYTRNFFYHTRNLLRKFQDGIKEEQIAFRVGQYKNDGLNDEQARKAAEKDYNKSIRSDIAGFVVYGALLNILWRLVGQVPYLLFGDDDDKKKQILDEATSGGAWFSPFTGLLCGGIVESALDGNGSVADMFAPELPFTQDVKRAGQYLENDKYAEFANQALSVAMQSGTGFDPQTAGDMIQRIVTTIDSEEELSAAEQALRISQALLSIPQSQYEQQLVDRVVADESEYDAALADYIRYQKVHTAPLTWWMRGEESDEKAEENAEKRFNRLLNERDALHNPEDYEE